MRLFTALALALPLCLPLACGGNEASPPAGTTSTAGRSGASSGGPGGGGAGAGSATIAGSGGASVGSGGASAGGASQGGSAGVGMGGTASTAGAGGGSAGTSATAGAAGMTAGAGGDGGTTGTAGKGGTTGSGGKAPVDPNPTQYENPVLEKSGDPFCARFGAWYYLYLPDQIAGGKGGRVLVFRSKNLVDWEPRGEAYDNVDEERGGQKSVGLWAPEVLALNGKYYLYYASVMNGAKDPDVGDKDIVVVESDDPEHFKGGKRTVLLDDAYAFIDPSPFLDPKNGNMFLYFKHRGAQGGGSAIHVRPLKDPSTFDGPGKELFSSNDVPNAANIVEHPMVFREDDTFFLLYSRGQGDNATYQIAYATSKGAQGPFTQQGVLFRSDDNPGVNTAKKVIAPGASSIVRDAAKETWIVYRQKTGVADTFGDRFVAIDPVTFKPGQLTIEGHPSRGEKRKAPAAIGP